MARTDNRPRTDNRQGQRHLVRGMLAGAAGGLAATFVMNQFHKGLSNLTENKPAEKEKKSGPIAHYAFASAIGALYGASVEYSPIARTVFGTFFASALFVGADARKLVRSGLRILA